MQRGSRLRRLAAALCWYRPRRLTAAFDDEEDDEPSEIEDAIDNAAGDDRGQGQAISGPTT